MVQLTGEGTTRGWTTVLRTELLERIEFDAGWRLLLITAPAGYGKSVLLSQIAQRLGGSARVRQIGEAQEIINLVEAANVRSQMHSDDVVIIDDYQRIASVQLGHALLALTGICRVVVASRTQPALECAKLEIDGKVLVMTANDLRFERDETRKAFAGSGYLREELDDIHDRSEGWVTYLRHVANSFYQRALRGGVYRSNAVDSAMCRYFEENVYARLDDPTKAVLLATCLSELVTDGVLEIVGCDMTGEAAISRLASDGLFLQPLRDDGVGFRYHAIFRDFLMKKLTASTSDETRKARHLRLAAWSLAQGEPANAIGHYLDGGDNTTALDLLDRAADQLIREEQLGSVARFAERIPGDALATRISAATAAVIAFCMRGDYLKANALLETIRRSGDTAGGGADIARIHALEIFVFETQGFYNDAMPAAQLSLTLPARDKPFEHGIALNAYGRWLSTRGRFEEAQESLLRAESVHDSIDNEFGRAYQKGFLAASFVQQGRLDEARRLLVPALRRAESRGPGSISGSIVAAYLSEVHYEENELARAQSLLRDYLPLIEKQALVDVVALAFTVLGRTAAAEDRTGEANDLFMRAMSIGFQHDWRSLATHARAEIVRLAVISGDLDGAERRMLSDPGGHLDTEHREAIQHPADAEGVTISWIRLFIHQNKTAKARYLLKREVRLAEIENRRRRLVRLRILGSIADYIDGRRNESVRAMLSAIELDGDHKMVRTFLDEGPPVISILSTIVDECAGVADDKTLSHARRLLEHAGCPRVMTIQPAVEVSDQLTDRERAVLRCVATGMTTRDLATRIAVSENTAKFHLRNIYSKCGIHNRVQAINLAASLGLVAN